MDQKNRKRNVPELDDAQIRTLVELVARNASNGEIGRKLDISEIDIGIVLNKLGIDSTETAKTMLKSYLAEDENNAIKLDKLREQARLDNRAAQERFNKQGADRDAAEKTRLSDAHQRAQQMVDEIKAVDAARQRRFSQQNKKTGDLLEQYRVPSTRYVDLPIKVSGGKFPDNLETVEFREMLLRHGLNFIRDKYNVTNEDIRAEIASRDVKLNFDLLPK
jgi:hypothetical protein